MKAWMNYAKGLAYLLIGYVLQGVSEIIPGIMVVGPWLTTFFGVAGVAVVIAGAVKVFETFLHQFELKGIYADIGKILIASGILYAYPPIKDFADKYQLLYGEVPSHDAMKGYVAVYTLKTAIEQVGSFDEELVRTWLHENTITTDMEPRVFLDTSYREDGTVDRDFFLVKIENGEQVIVQVISTKEE